jgi:putative PIN family toxin of toxin-antitoxin system
MKHFAVIDTNVIVSALLKWNSVPGVVLQAVFNGFVVPVYNEEILNEYRNVLNRPKFGFSKELISETISQIEAMGVQEMALESVSETMPDPKDIVFYSIALAHGKTAETHLVTGNIKHFPVNPIVVTPRQMLDILCM